MKSTFDEFGREIMRVVAFAWSPHPNMYQEPVWAKKASTPTPDDAYKKGEDAQREPLACLQGIGVLNRVAQAASIKGKLKRNMSKEGYATLELKFLLPSDAESARNKMLALQMVTDRLMRDTSSQSEYADRCCRQYGGMDVDRQARGKAFGKLREYLDLALFEAELILDRRGE